MSWTRHLMTLTVVALLSALLVSPVVAQSSSTGGQQAQAPKQNAKQSISAADIEKAARTAVASGDDEDSVAAPPPIAWEFSSGTAQPMSLGPPAPLGAPQDAGEEAPEDSSGTDPSVLGYKFMPYYRFMEVDTGQKAEDPENPDAPSPIGSSGIQDHRFITLFGMIPLNKSRSFAMAYEWPMIFSRNLPPNFQGAPPVPPGFPSGIPPSEGAVVTGFNDVLLRFVYIAKSWRGRRANGTPKSFTVGFGSDFVFPFATDPRIGSEKYQMAPMGLFVWKPLPFFFVANLYFHYFSYASTNEGEDRPDIHFGFMRTFLNFSFKNGTYFLPEFQTMLDYKNDNVWVMMMPEVGAVIRPGLIVYVKPGVGLFHEVGEPRWSAEVGMRIFFDRPWPPGPPGGNNDTALQSAMNDARTRGAPRRR